MSRQPQQGSLFEELPTVAPNDSMRKETFPVQDGELTLYHNWLSASESTDLFSALQSELAWEQSVIQIYGRAVAIPRLNAWYADPGCDYKYSGYQLPLHAWQEPLTKLRQRLDSDLGLGMNSVLANLYRDGEDGVGWHSDDEPELGVNPEIASISLGAERSFHLKHRFKRNSETLKLILPAGSLLVMGGELQHHWQHCLPKSRKVREPRINLTFRCIKMK